MRESIFTRSRFIELVGLFTVQGAQDNPLLLEQERLDEALAAARRRRDYRHAIELDQMLFKSYARPGGYEMLPNLRLQAVDDYLHVQETVEAIFLLKVVGKAIRPKLMIGPCPTHAQYRTAAEYMASLPQGPTKFRPVVTSFELAANGDLRSALAALVRSRAHAHQYLDWYFGNGFDLALSFVRFGLKQNDAAFAGLFQVARTNAEPSGWLDQFQATAAATLAANSGAWVPRYAKIDALACEAIRNGTSVRS